MKQVLLDNIYDVLQDNQPSKLTVSEITKEIRRSKNENVNCLHIKMALLLHGKKNGIHTSFSISKLHVLYYVDPIKRIEITPIDISLD